jgi:hypothetical protein
MYNDTSPSGGWQLSWAKVLVLPPLVDGPTFNAEVHHRIERLPSMLRHDRAYHRPDFWGHFSRGSTRLSASAHLPRTTVAFLYVHVFPVDDYGGLAVATNDDTNEGEDKNATHPPAVVKLENYMPYEYDEEETTMCALAVSKEEDEAR